MAGEGGGRGGAERESGRRGLQSRDPPKSLPREIGLRVTMRVPGCWHGVASQMRIGTGRCLPRGVSAWRVTLRPAHPAQGAHGEQSQK